MPCFPQVPSRPPPIYRQSFQEVEIPMQRSIRDNSHNICDMSSIPSLCLIVKRTNACPASSSSGAPGGNEKTAREARRGARSDRVRPAAEVGSFLAKLDDRSCPATLSQERFRLVRRKVPGDTRSV